MDAANSTAFWVVGIIVLFILGSILGLRVSPREKALGELRDKARKMSLHPRLVPAPEWSQIPKASETRASMVAYYSILVPEGKFPLIRAVIQAHALHVITGQHPLDGQHIALKGVFAIDMQANCVGAYWDESEDFHGEQLEQLKAYLHAFTQLT
jgi:hypothetical protein